jgi:hypothetical protein
MSANKNFYASLNRTLRNENRNKIKSYFSSLKFLHTGVSKTATSGRVKVWRGVKKNVSDKFNKEETLTWWTVTLCSKELDTSEPFLG